MAYRKFEFRLAALRLAWVVYLAGFVCGVVPGDANQRELKTLHFASNGNFDSRGMYLPARAGFDLADVSGRRELDLLPKGVKGLVWIGSCKGVDAQFKAAVLNVISHPRLFGFYLMDDPDPTGRWHQLCSANNLKAESDWIHQHRPDAITFIALMNLKSSSAPSFGGWYTPETTHIDLFGISPYPCRIEWATCDFVMIDRYVEAAVASGIPVTKLVPIYQTFGLGAWRTDTGGRYRMPDPEEMKTMHRRWMRLVPSPVFDYAYSWATQRHDKALESAAGLQDVFLIRNSDPGFQR